MRHLSSRETLQNGRYTIENSLGGGGFGITYLAQDNKNHRRVVIKSLNAMMQGKPNFEELQSNFVKEAFLLAKCGHQNVVQVFDVFDEEIDQSNRKRLWFMVMEYIQGDDLAIHLQKKGVLSEAEGLKIVEQIGNALSYVYSQGFLHRDVKPNNILLRADNNEAILIDFGIAREFVAGETRTHSNYRTDGYAPPEQYEEKAQRGAYTDVYALAATLYHILTDQIPLPANFRQAIPLPPPQQYNARISDRVNEAILKGMELETSKRPQTIEDWLNLFAMSPKPNIVGAQGLRPQPLRPTPQPNDDLSSEKGINYEELQDLLKAGKWKEANQKTSELMLKVTCKDSWQDFYLFLSKIKSSPKRDLLTIDQLWLKYSRGKFGFSVQKQIWLDCGGKVGVNDYHIYDICYKFADKVQWLKQGNWLSSDELNFTNNVIKGHLPWVCWVVEDEFCQRHGSIEIWVINAFSYIFSLV